MPLTKPTQPAAVDAVPTPVPQRSDMANFAVRGDLMMTWFPTGIAGINTNLNYVAAACNYIEEQNTLAQTAVTNATAQVGLAAAQVTLAAAEKTAASGFADAAAASAGAAVWVSGATIALNAVVFSPTNKQLYRRITATGSGTTDPASDTTNYAPLGQLQAVAVAALNVDCGLGNYFTKTIAGASTFTFSNAPASPVRFAFILRVQHTSGTITWPASVVWPGGTAPSLTTGKYHLFMFITENGGTTWRGSSQVDYAS